MRPERKKGSHRDSDGKWSNESTVFTGKPLAQGLIDSPQSQPKRQKVNKNVCLGICLTTKKNVFLFLILTIKLLQDLGSMRSFHKHPEPPSGIIKIPFMGSRPVTQLILDLHVSILVGSSFFFFLVKTLIQKSQKTLQT